MKSKNSSSEKYFRKFRVEYFLKFWKSENFRKSKNRLFIENQKNRYFLENLKKFDPRNFQKYFSDEEFFDFKIFLNILVFLFEPLSKIVSPYAWPMFLASTRSRISLFSENVTGYCNMKPLCNKQEQCSFSWSEVHQPAVCGFECASYSISETFAIFQIIGKNPRTFDKKFVTKS